MSLKALADAVIRRDSRAGQERDIHVDKCPNPTSIDGTSVPASEAARVYGSEVPASPVVVELIYVEPQPKVTPVSPEFPPCRKCGARRFWIADSGKVVCGGRRCGEVCYILASIEYHPIS